MAPDSANPPYEGTPTGTKIIRNVAFGALRVLLLAPIPLLLTPFVIKHVGAPGLGIWAIFLAVNGLSSLADLGVFGTLTRHVAEHYATQNYLQLNKAVNAGVVVFVAAALLSTLVLNVASGFIVSVFLWQAPVPAVQLQHAVRLLSLALSMNLLAFPFSSIIAGLQRLDLAHLISAISTIGIAAGAALSLSLGFGIQGLAYPIVIGAGLNLVLSLTAAWRVLPQLKLSTQLVGFGDVKDLFSFSLKMYVTQIAVVVHNHIEKFLLAHFAGLTSAGWYDVANDLSAKARGVPSLLLSPLLPAASELQARQDDTRVLQLYRRSQKYLALMGVLIVSITVLLARRFVQIWLGPGFAPVAFALVILTSVQLINLASGPGLFIFIGRGELSPGVRSAMGGIILNVVLSTLLIWRFGFTGGVYGTALALSLATAYFIIMFHRGTGYPFSLVLAPYVKPLICGLLLTLVARSAVPIGRLGWAGMAVTAAGFAGVYLGGLIAMRYFDAFDARAIGQVLQMRKAFRRILTLA